MAIEEKDVILNGKINGKQQIQYPATRWRNIIDPEQMFHESYPLQNIFGGQLYALDQPYQDRLRDRDQYSFSSYSGGGTRNVSFATPEFEGFINGRRVKVPVLVNTVTNVDSGYYITYYLLFNAKTEAFTILAKPGINAEDHVDMTDIGEDQQLAGYFGHIEVEGDLYFYPSEHIYVTGEPSDFGIRNSESFPLLETAEVSTGQLGEYLRCALGSRIRTDALADGILSLDVKHIVLKNDADEEAFFHTLTPGKATVYVIEQCANGSINRAHLLFSVCDRDAGANERYRQIKFTGDMAATRYLDTFDGSWSSWKSMNTTGYDLELTINGETKSFDGSRSVKAGWFAPATGGTAGYLLKSNGTGNTPTWVYPYKPMVIAASNASTAIKESADFVCDGIADEEQINDAISQIGSSGGCIELTAGTFVINTAVYVTNHITIRGSGHVTILQRNFTALSSAQFEGLFNLSDNCRVENLSMDGNSRATNYGSCIHLTGINSHVECVAIQNHSYGICISGSYNTAQHCFFTGGYSTIIAYSLYIHSDAAENILHQNILTENSVNGAPISVSGKDNCIRDNVITNNKRPGILAYGDYNTFIGNRISNSTEHGIEIAGDYNVLVGNHATGNARYGIALAYGSNNTVTGNLLIDNNSSSLGGGGIQIHGSNNVVDGNNCICGKGASSDYTESIDTIRVASVSKNNLISNNLILGKNYVNEGNSTNTFVNNKYS